MQTAQSTPAHHPVLTRDLLAAGHATALLSQDQPGARLRSDAERQASLARFMVTRPPGDLWVFAYGSLVWNPAMRVAERRVALVQGWHRSFCLSVNVGRGTADAPGLVLGLDRGGVCHGLAYRIAERDIGFELPILWNREMSIGGYNPIWVDAVGRDGRKLGSAISFAIDSAHEHYAGGLPQDEKVRRLATAKGSWGSSADYLFRTIRGLRDYGIRDEELESLWDRVGALAATR
jgi:cation transport protein ChaC